MAKKKSRKELIYTVMTIHKMDSCFIQFSLFKKGFYFDRWIFHQKWRKMVKSYSLKKKIEHIREESESTTAHLWERLTKPLIKEVHSDNFYDALQEKNNYLYLFNYFHAWNKQIHSLRNFHDEMHDQWHIFVARYKALMISKRVMKLHQSNQKLDIWRQMAFNIRLEEIKDLCWQEKERYDTFLLWKEFTFTAKKINFIDESMKLQKQRKLAEKWQELSSHIMHKTMIEICEIDREQLTKAQKIFILIDKIVKKRKTEVLYQEKEKLNEKTKKKTMQQALEQWRKSCFIQAQTNAFSKKFFQNALQEYTEQVAQYNARRIQRWWRKMLIVRKKRRELLFNCFMLWKTVPSNLEDMFVFPIMETRLKQKIIEPKVVIPFKEVDLDPLGEIYNYHKRIQQNIINTSKEKGSVYVFENMEFLLPNDEMNQTLTSFIRKGVAHIVYSQITFIDFPSMMFEAMMEQKKEKVQDEDHHYDISDDFFNAISVSDIYGHSNKSDDETTEFTTEEPATTISMTETNYDESTNTIDDSSDFSRNRIHTSDFNSTFGNSFSRTEEESSILTNQNDSIQTTDDPTMQSHDTNQEKEEEEENEQFTYEDKNKSTPLDTVTTEKNQENLHVNFISTQKESDSSSSSHDSDSHSQKEEEDKHEEEEKIETIEESKDDNIQEEKENNEIKPQNDRLLHYVDEYSESKENTHEESVENVDSKKQVSSSANSEYEDDISIPNIVISDAYSSDNNSSHQTPRDNKEDNAEANQENNIEEHMDETQIEMNSENDSTIQEPETKVAVQSQLTIIEEEEEEEEKYENNNNGEINNGHIGIEDIPSLPSVSNESNEYDSNNNNQGLPPFGFDQKEQDQNESQQHNHEEEEEEEANETENTTQSPEKKPHFPPKSRSPLKGPFFQEASLNTAIDISGASKYESTDIEIPNNDEDDQEESNHKQNIDNEEEEEEKHEDQPQKSNELPQNIPQIQPLEEEEEEEEVAEKQQIIDFENKSTNESHSEEESVINQDNIPELQSIQGGEEDEEEEDKITTNQLPPFNPRFMAKHDNNTDEESSTLDEFQAMMRGQNQPENNEKQSSSMIDTETEDEFQAMMKGKLPQSRKSSESDDDNRLETPEESNNINNQNIISPDFTGFISNEVTDILKRDMENIDIQINEVHADSSSILQTNEESNESPESPDIEDQLLGSSSSSKNDNQQRQIIPQEIKVQLPDGLSEWLTRTYQSVSARVVPRFMFDIQPQLVSSMMLLTNDDDYEEDLNESQNYSANQSFDGQKPTITIPDDWFGESFDTAVENIGILAVASPIMKLLIPISVNLDDLPDEDLSKSSTSITAELLGGSESNSQQKEAYGSTSPHQETSDQNQPEKIPSDNKEQKEDNEEGSNTVNKVSSSSSSSDEENEDGNETDKTNSTLEQIVELAQQDHISFLDQDFETELPDESEHFSISIDESYLRDVEDPILLRQSMSFNRFKLGRTSSPSSPTITTSYSSPNVFEDEKKVKPVLPDSFDMSLSSAILTTVMDASSFPSNSLDMYLVIKTRTMQDSSSSSSSDEEIDSDDRIDSSEGDEKEFKTNMGLVLPNQELDYVPEALNESDLSLPKKFFRGQQQTGDFFRGQQGSDNEEEGEEEFGGFFRGEPQGRRDGDGRGGDRFFRGPQRGGRNTGEESFRRGREEGRQRGPENRRRGEQREKARGPENKEDEQVPRIEEDNNGSWLGDGSSSSTILPNEMRRRRIAQNLKISNPLVAVDEANKTNLSASQIQPQINNENSNKAYEYNPNTPETPKENKKKKRGKSPQRLPLPPDSALQETDHEIDYIGKSISILNVAPTLPSLLTKTIGPAVNIAIHSSIKFSIPFTNTDMDVPINNFKSIEEETPHVHISPPEYSSTEQPESSSTQHKSDNEQIQSKQSTISNEKVQQPMQQKDSSVSQNNVINKEIANGLNNALSKAINSSINNSLKFDIDGRNEENKEVSTPKYKFDANDQRLKEFEVQDYDIELPKTPPIRPTPQKKDDESQDYKSNIHLSQIPTIGSPHPSFSDNTENTNASVPPPFNPPSLPPPLPSPSQQTISNTDSQSQNKNYNNTLSPPEVYVPNSSSDEKSNSNNTNNNNNMQIGSSSSPFEFQQVSNLPFSKVKENTNKELNNALITSLSSIIKFSLPNLIATNDVADIGRESILLSQSRKEFLPEAPNVSFNDPKESLNQNIKFPAINIFVNNNLESALSQSVYNVINNDIKHSDTISEYTEVDIHNKVIQRNSSTFPRVTSYTNNSLSNTLNNALSKIFSLSIPNMI